MRLEETYSEEYFGVAPAILLFAAAVTPSIKAGKLDSPPGTTISAYYLSQQTSYT